MQRYASVSQNCVFCKIVLGVHLHVSVSEREGGDGKKETREEAIREREREKIDREIVIQNEI